MGFSGVGGTTSTDIWPLAALRNLALMKSFAFEFETVN